MGYFTSLLSVFFTLVCYAHVFPCRMAIQGQGEYNKVHMLHYLLSQLAECHAFSRSYILAASAW